MSTYKFIQVNNRNISETTEQMKECDFCVGFEVVNTEIIPLLFSNFDPQHTGLMLSGHQYDIENITCAKSVLRTIHNIQELNDPIIGVVVEKADIDAIAGMALYIYSDEIAPMEHGFPEEYGVFCKLCDRVKSIDKMDCGLGSQGTEWNPDYFNNLRVESVSPFNVLGCMVSDFKTPLNIRVELMRRWLVEGYLPEHYRQQVEKEMEAQTEAIITIQPDGFPCVTSTARGVSNIIYSIHPFGVAFNPEFPTPNGKIAKFTIMSFNTKYIDLQAILNEISELEKGWGGNLQAGIIGSPFAGTNLEPSAVCSIVAKHVK